MKKIIILFMALLLTTGVMQSQVKIGGNAAPEKGAILDLNGTVTRGGLVLPHVNITDLGKIPAHFTDASVQGQDKVYTLVGLIVWNTNDNTGSGGSIIPGIYMWDGDNWNLLNAEKICGNASVTPASTAGNQPVTAIEGNPLTLTVTGGGSPVLSYQWYKGGSAIGGATSATYTKTAATGDEGNYYCVVTSSCNGSSAQSATFVVTFFAIGCVKSTLPAGKLCFMTYNLGASSTMTMAQQMAYVPGSLAGTDATTDSTVYGAMYQWGRWTDGHQMRTSTNAAGPMSGANLNSTTGQIQGTNASSFVYNTVSPYDWRSPQLTTLWGATKTQADPCPSGWRVPTKDELASIYTSLTAPNTWTWNSTGTPGYKLSPDGGAHYSLFLPSTGYRNYVNGNLVSVGSNGYLWSSTVTGTTSYYFYINIGGSMIPANNTARGNGMGVRCVVE